MCPISKRKPNSLIPIFHFTKVFSICTMKQWTCEDDACFRKQTVTFSACSSLSRWSPQQHLVCCLQGTGLVHSHHHHLCKWLNKPTCCRPYMPSICQQDDHIIDQRHTQGTEFVFLHIEQIRLILLYRSDDLFLNEIEQIAVEQHNKQRTKETKTKKIQLKYSLLLISNIQSFEALLVMKQYHSTPGFLITDKRKCHLLFICKSDMLQADSHRRTHRGRE